MSPSRETLCVHGANHAHPDEKRSLTVPIYQTAAFSHLQLGHNEHGFDYTRISNPTREHLEETVSALEGAKRSLAFTSGMAAISAVFELFAPGDRVVCSEDLYGGTVLLMDLVGKKNGLELSFVDTTDPQALTAAVTAGTKAIYVETPSNPMMNVTDIRLCADLAKQAGALLIVDNTFLSPYFQNPLELGADIVVHSGTKYLCGHNDTLSGFLCFADEALADRVHKIAYALGAGLSPFDSYLMIRGIKTLALRMEHQNRSAQAIARWLQTHPKVKKVHYVGLEEHPGYALNASQSRGCGGMLSFTLESPETALQLLKKVKIITFAESLGGPESLMTLPALQTHRDVAEADRLRLGITDSLIRLSVGLENTQDLIDDLAQALE